jgi:integrase
MAKELTARGINALAIPSDGDRLTDYPDGKVPGLALRVFASGRRSWYLKYRQDGKQRRYKLGDHPTLGLQAARKAAEALRVGVRQGADPVRERRERAEEVGTFGELVAMYLDGYAKKNLAPRTLTERRRMLEGDDVKSLLAKPATEILPGDVAHALNRIEKRGSHVMLNRTQIAVSSVFTWALTRHIGGVQFNPVGALPRRFKEHARERWLDESEISDVWADLGARKMGAPTALRLVLVTAQRPGEVGALRWSHIDTAKRVWRMPEGYRKRPRGEPVSPVHDVPLSDLALSLLAKIREDNARTKKKGYRALAFPSETATGYPAKDALPQAARRVVRKLDMERWTPHDLRRTAATHMTKLGHARLIVDKIIGHKDTSVAGIYDRYSYWDERVAAMDVWSAKLSVIVGGGR